MLSNIGSYHLLVTSRSDDYFLRSDGHLRSDEQMVEVIRSDRHFKWLSLEVTITSWEIIITWSDEQMVEVIRSDHHFKWRSLGEKWSLLLRNNDQMVEATLQLQPMYLITFWRWRSSFQKLLNWSHQSLFDFNCNIWCSNFMFIVREHAAVQVQKSKL